jgi:hypothetical protein
VSDHSPRLAPFDLSNIPIDRLREPSLAAFLAGSLAAIFAWLGPPGNDLAAHVYLRWEFLQHGLVFWNNLWYSGRYSYITYSPLYYPLAGLVGIRLLAVITIAAAALAFSLLVTRQWGASARWASRSFAVLWAGIVFSGAFPFVLGAALGLFALLALQARKDWRFGLLSFFAMVSSPLAFAFLVLVVAALGLDRARAGLSSLRAPALAIAAPALIGIVAWRAFPSDGRYPFQVTILLEIAAFCLAGTALTWKVEEAQLLRWIFPLYLGASLVVFAVPSQLGSNIGRLRLVALPVALLVLALRGFRPRLLAAPLLALALAWNLGPIVDGFRAGHADPSGDRAYWAPAIDFLHRNLTPSYRVETVDTANHWAAVYLPEAGIPIARGWFRQDDHPQNEILYRDLDRPSYLRWLRGLGVRYIVLTAAPTDYSSSAEAALIRSGRSGLRLALRTSKLTVWEVPDARPIVTGEGHPRVLSLEATKIRLSLPSAGSFRVAVRYSPYLRLGGGCVTKGPGGFAEVSVERGGEHVLGFDAGPGRIFSTIFGDSGQHCG